MPQQNKTDNVPNIIGEQDQTVDSNGVDFSLLLKPSDEVIGHYRHHTIIHRNDNNETIRRLIKKEIDSWPAVFDSRLLFMDEYSLAIWDNICDEKSYVTFESCIAILKESLKDPVRSKELLAYQSFVSLGCGTGRKDSLLLRYILEVAAASKKEYPGLFQNHCRLTKKSTFRYNLIDSSLNMLESAAHTLFPGSSITHAERNETIPEIVTIAADIYSIDDYEYMLRQKKEDKCLYMLLGNTLGNLKITSFFNRMFDVLDPGDGLLLSIEYFMLNPDIDYAKKQETINNIYNNKINKYKDSDNILDICWTQLKYINKQISTLGTSTTKTEDEIKNLIHSIVTKGKSSIAINPVPTNEQKNIDSWGALSIEITVKEKEPGRPLEDHYISSFVSSVFELTTFTNMVTKYAEGRYNKEEDGRHAEVSIYPEREENGQVKEFGIAHIHLKLN